ncbi:HNH endonuclease [Mycoplasma capricolum]|uniref:HNH endonuclease n=1 Tax=Mycoplasma capricolum TaxID=2095 RepID=UPI0022F38EAB|nr:HNH endonuclease [Mycoplasma capricolum]
MKVSEVLNSSNIRQLFFVFFNLNIQKNDQFLIKITYKNSQFSTLELNDKIYTENNILMSKYTSIDMSFKERIHYVLIENDLNIDREIFLHNIFKRIQQLRLHVEQNQFEKALYLGLFAFRVSADLSLNFYSVDLLNYNNFYSHWEDIISLLISSSAIKQLNLNFRELQPDYINNNKKRNTQIRINLKWFYDNLVDDISKINIYKSKLLKDNKSIISNLQTVNTFKNSFIQRLNYYKNKILNFKDINEQLTKEQIQKMRKGLNFAIEENSTTARNSQVVIFAKVMLPDFCFACKDIYELNSRTFIHRQTNKPYLEIHHVLPFSANKSADVFENLVKLCPACHKALSKNRALEGYQKKLIKNIIDNNVVVNEYLDNFIENNQNKVDFIYDRLM